MKLRTDRYLMISSDCQANERPASIHMPERATLIAEKVDGAGRHVRQIELFARRCNVVIVRERARGLEICDRRNAS